MVDQDSATERLSQIATLWSLVRQAHTGPTQAAADARRELMQRYYAVVYRYLLGALRDEEAALELFQEFALRFVRGDFRRANPAAGRFRDYVRTALMHLVADYRRAQRDRPRSLPADLAARSAPPDGSPDPGAAFLGSWREELVNRAWDALAEAQPTFHAVLLFHVQHPEVPSARAAEQLTARLGKPFSPTAVRVLLHRARGKFADLLLEEVARSLGKPTETTLAQELRDLQLLKLCGSALERRGRREPPGQGRKKP
jgi:RNA polymerase sigma-70 factor (ECF subfamily)